MQEKLIQNYLKSNPDYFNEICSNSYFLEKIFQLEASLHSRNRKKKENPGKAIHPVKEIQLLQLAEDFVSTGRVSFKKANQDIWQEILSDNSLFLCFQEIVWFISSKGSKDHKTPLYLKKIALKRTVKAVKSNRNIIIATKDPLRLLNHDLKNLFQLSPLQEGIATRYIESSVTDSGILQFLSKGKDADIIFQVLKDGEDTISMTLKLSKFSTLPVNVTLCKDDRVIQKRTAAEKLIHFTHLQPGDYQIELRKKAGNFEETINVSIVDDSESV